MATARLECHFIAGPTAAGKSAVAQHIAETAGHEIVSADSMQVYAGMDVGTAKPTAEERRRVRYHMLDVASPDRTYSAGAFRKEALKALRDASRRGRSAIVVGGTGLYLKALTDGLRSTAPASPDRRACWENLYRREGLPGLQQALQTRAPAFWESLADRCNPRRLIRALELAETGTQEPSATWRRASAAPTVVGIDRSPAALRLRIEKRVEEMYSQGLLEETRQLAARFPGLSRTARHAIGYAEALACIEGSITLDQAKARTATRTRQLAKRQRTWFRTQMNVFWVRLEEETRVEEAARTVARAWERVGPAPLAQR